MQFPLTSNFYVHIDMLHVFGLVLQGIVWMQKKKLIVL